MDTTECIAFLREQASLSDQSTEWDSTKLLQLLNQARVEVFEPIITACVSGYWVHVLTRTLGANNNVVRLPPRAAAFMHVDLRRGTDKWYPLQEFTEAEQQDWERMGSSYPQGYTIRGTTMHLVPAAVDGSYSIRVKIVIRPSKLYLPQALGIVNAVDYTTGILTVTALPNNNLTSSPITGTLDVDVIEPIDNFELSLFNAQATVLDGTHVQVAAGFSVNKIQVGDYLRAANQSDWPQLPEPWHHVLASAAAITPCSQRDLYDRANDLRQMVSSAANRLAAHLKPRSMTQTQERRPVPHSWE